MYKKIGKSCIALLATIVTGSVLAANPFVLPKSGSYNSTLLFARTAQARCEEQGEEGASIRYLCRKSVVLVNLLPFNGVVFEEYSLRSRKLVRRCRVIGRDRVRCRRK